MAQPIINAVECIECGHIEESTDYESAHPGDTPPECMECGEATTNWVRVESCDQGDVCSSDDHHYGIGKHVIEV